MTPGAPGVSAGAAIGMDQDSARPARIAARIVRAPRVIVRFRSVTALRHRGHIVVVVARRTVGRRSDQRRPDDDRDRRAARRAPEPVPLLLFLLLLWLGRGLLVLLAFIFLAFVLLALVLLPFVPSCRHPWEARAVR